MHLKNSFITKIEHLNGRKVRVTIVQIMAENHPLGPLGFIMMGPQQKDRISKADKMYNGKNGTINIEADLELIQNEKGYTIMLLSDKFECNCIEVFRPEPPMIISGSDMSLWWSYHTLTEHSHNKLHLLKSKYSIRESNNNGDCHTIRELLINDIRHCG